MTDDKACGGILNGVAVSVLKKINTTVSNYDLVALRCDYVGRILPCILRIERTKI
jgi:hypothetical protein